MKKILLLGGSEQQIIAVKVAKKLGYYTILCDYLVDNPGQYHANKFYLVSTTNKEDILEIATNENIDGIIAYASDPAAPTAAYVAEILNLPTSPYESVETLCNKDKFRSFLRNNGFNSPACYSYVNAKIALKETSSLKLPIIIKPVDSSGSKGVTVLHSFDGLEAAINFALLYSRSQRIIVEEYIEKKHSFLIGGDVFVKNGQIILWGLMNCHRDYNVNALVPVGKSYPLDLDETDINIIKSTLQEIVDKLHLTSCAMNVELILDKNNNVWPIDIGPRNGGNMIPDLLGLIFNVDVVEMSIKAAMGDDKYHVDCDGAPFYATHNLHSSMSGFFEGIDFSEEIKLHIIKICIYKKCGDKVEYFDDSSKAIGIVFLKFDNREEMQRILSAINNHIHVLIKEKK